MATLQVKGIEDDLYEALRARAAMDNRSISQEVVAFIKDSLARPAASAREATEAFLGLAGSWQDERTAREIAREIRKARRGGKRFSNDVFA